MPRRTKRKKAVDAADKSASLYVRQRDKRCVLCGSTERLTCGHLITRTKYSVRWDERNMYCQCAGCNFRHEHDSHPFTVWYIKRFGVEDYADLVFDSNKIKKLTTNDLLMIAAAYNAKREAL